MNTCKTVKVKGGESGFYLINEEDFDPKVHKEHKEPVKRVIKKKAAKK